MYIQKKESTQRIPLCLPHHSKVSIFLKAEFVIPLLFHFLDIELSTYLPSKCHSSVSSIIIHLSYLSNLSNIYIISFIFYHLYHFMGFLALYAWNHTLCSLHWSAFSIIIWDSSTLLHVTVRYKFSVFWHTSVGHPPPPAFSFLFVPRFVVTILKFLCMSPNVSFFSQWDRTIRC